MKISELALHNEKIDIVALREQFEVLEILPGEANERAIYFRDNCLRIRQGFTTRLQKSEGGLEQVASQIYSELVNNLVRVI